MLFKYFNHKILNWFKIIEFCIKNKNNYLDPDAVTDIMNTLTDENEQLKEINQELKLENSKHIGNGEWDIKDITCMHGKFRLEEWGERYHQFYNGDKQLEDEEVVSLLFENEQLKQQIENTIREADNMDCNCNPCVVEECVTKVIQR